MANSITETDIGLTIRETRLIIAYFDKDYELSKICKKSIDFLSLKCKTNLRICDKIKNIDKY